MPLPPLDAGAVESYLNSLQAGGAIDGGDVLLAFDDPNGGTWALGVQVLADDGAIALPTSGSFDRPPIPANLASSGPDGLVASVNNTFGYYPASSSGWASQPTVQFTADVYPGCSSAIASFYAMTSFPLTSAQPVDQIALSIGEAFDPPCQGDAVVVYDLTRRSASVLVTADELGRTSPSAQAIDLDAEGNTDLLIAYQSEPAPFIAWGSGDGQFVVTPVPVNLSALQSQILAADFDGDGYPDLAFVATQGVVNVLYNDGPAHPRSFH